MTVATRFAPSPTGRLHVGNLRIALHNWLWARKHGGRFLLRLDDTDARRSSEEHAEAIRHDLEWLALRPDGEVRQSARAALHDGAFDRLVTSGRIYPAYESEQELELKRRVLLGRGLPPVYDRAALALSAGERAALERDGRRPHWRFRLDHARPITWEDMIRGPQRLDPASLSDPVVRRADGSWLYLFPSVVDDAELGITHVLRGEDHVTNTGLQIQMFEALDHAPPVFAHESLLVSADGKLSKRLGADGIDPLRAGGIEPLALAALLARIGTSDPVKSVGSLDELARGFDLSRFGRAPAQFDEAELQRLNAKMVHALPFGAVAHRLPSGMSEAAWEAIRANITTVPEAEEWWTIATSELHAPTAAEADRALLAEAANAAAEIDWSAAPWQALTALLKDRTGRTGRALFLPLRRALTARDGGPDMASFLPLIGQDRAIDRLRRAAND